MVRNQPGFSHKPPQEGKSRHAFSRSRRSPPSLVRSDGRIPAAREAAAVGATAAQAGVGLPAPHRGVLHPRGRHRVQRGACHAAPLPRIDPGADPAGRLADGGRRLLHRPVLRRPDTGDASAVRARRRPARTSSGSRTTAASATVSPRASSRHPNADMYLCVDSDTVLDKHAVAELAEPFSKRRVHCVTGLVLAHNRGTNLLTRLIDMRYVNAFLGERVAYSRLGSVLCACGSLAMYRGWVVRKYVDDFLDQRFLGRPATFGDDRRLTYYCLTEGLSLIQPSLGGLHRRPRASRPLHPPADPLGQVLHPRRASCSSASSGSAGCTGGSTWSSWSPGSSSPSACSAPWC